MHTLAGLYARGLGVSKDPIQAYVWSSLAVKNYAETEPKREPAIKLRDTMEKLLTQDDRRKASKMIEEWHLKPPAPEEASQSS
jgi:TPR repeat protein